MRRPESREETPKEGDAVRIPHRNKIAPHRTKVKPESGTSCTNYGHLLRYCRFNFQQNRLYKRHFGNFRRRLFAFHHGK